MVFTDTLIVDGFCFHFGSYIAKRATHRTFRCIKRNNTPFNSIAYSIYKLTFNTLAPSINWQTIEVCRVAGSTVFSAVWVNCGVNATGYRVADAIYRCSFDASTLISLEVEIVLALKTFDRSAFFTILVAILFLATDLSHACSRITDHFNGKVCFTADASAESALLAINKT